MFPEAPSSKKDLRFLQEILHQETGNTTGKRTLSKSRKHLCQPQIDLLGILATLVALEKEPQPLQGRFVSNIAHVRGWEGTGRETGVSGALQLAFVE